MMLTLSDRDQASTILIIAALPTTVCFYTQIHKIITTNSTMSVHAISLSPFRYGIEFFNNNLWL